MIPARRCLVIHAGALGDVLLALPALAHLGRLGFHRVLAAAPRLVALLEGSPAAEEGIELDRLGLHHLFTSTPDAAALDMLAAYDVVVSWFGAGEPIYAAHLGRLGRPVVIGRAAPSPESCRHASWHLIETLASLGPVPDALPAVRLRAHPAERAWVEAWLGGRGLRPGEAVALHPGAGGPAKAWPGFPALARRLAAAGLPAVVVAGPADAAAVARLVEDAGVAGSVIARDLPLPRLVALFEAARAFVGNDSGLSHLAAAVGCPTLALFGPTDPAVWAPVGPCARALAGDGPGAADPWDGLTPERVAAATVELVQAVPAPATAQSASPLLHP